MRTRRLEAVLAVLPNELPKLPTVAAWARAVGISQSSLRSTLRSGLRTTPGKYIKEIRLTEAARLLCAKRELLIKEVVGIVGVNDVSHFVRDFEIRYGLSPIRFRLEMCDCDGHVVDFANSQRLTHSSHGSKRSSSN